MRNGRNQFEDIFRAKKVTIAFLMMVVRMKMKKQIYLYFEGGNLPAQCMTMMMMMMTRIKMENRKEQLEKNYLPSGWPDPGSPRCRNCAKRIVTIHTQKCYFLKEIITIRTERQYFFNFSSSKKLFRRKTFNILYGRPKIFSRAFTFVNWFCQICLKILTDIQQQSLWLRISHESLSGL